jgi:hypothetical protein
MSSSRRFRHLLLKGGKHTQQVHDSPPTLTMCSLAVEREPPGGASLDVRFVDPLCFVQTYFSSKVVFLPDSDVSALDFFMNFLTSPRPFDSQQVLIM